MANSEWVLCADVQHFQNLYNVEFRDNGTYCCCDNSFIEVPCQDDITLLNVAACTNECEPYYVIRFEVCFANGMCSNIKTEATAISNILAGCISPLLVQLASNESIINNITTNGDTINVSAQKETRKLFINNT